MPPDRPRSQKFGGTVLEGLAAGGAMRSELKMNAERALYRPRLAKLSKEDLLWIAVEARVAQYKILYYK